MNSRLSRADASAILHAARLMEGEANTWADCFARSNGETLRWDTESDFAQIRYIKLKASAKAMRAIAAKAHFEPEYFI